MKRLVKAAVLAMIASLGVTMSTYAESLQIKAKVPFSFEASGKSLPAGEYTFMVDDPDSPSLLTIQSKNGSKWEIMLTEEQEQSKPANENKVVFERYGDQNFLSQVWVAGMTTIQAVPQTEIQKELAQSDSKHETIPVAAHKG